MRKRRWQTAALTMGLVMWAMGAQADYAAALKHYEAKKFPEAFAEFKRLAELGDAPSQRILAAMLFNGEGIEIDRPEAWAWARLAADTDEPARNLLTDMNAKLDAAALKVGEERFAGLQAVYGRDALASNLLPVVSLREADCVVDDALDVVPIKSVAPRYPPRAAQSGVEGNFCAFFYLDAQGRPIEPEVYTEKVTQPGYARDFEDMVRKTLSQWQFQAPSDPLTKLAQRRYCMDFRLDRVRRDEKNAVQNMDEVTLRTRAAAGDAEAQYELARKIEHRLSRVDANKVTPEQLALWRSAAHHVMVGSARNGNASAQFSIAKRLLTGERCEKDARKGVVWLTMAAQQGHSDAQLQLALRLARGDGVEMDREKAWHWLRAAAGSGSSRARTLAAWLTIMNGPEHAASALALLPQTRAQGRSDSDLFQLEVRALAAAYSGAFQEAEKLQEQVQATAARLGLATEVYHRWQQAYSAGQLPGEEERIRRADIASL